MPDKYFKEQMNNHLSKTIDENLHKIFSQTLYNSQGLGSLPIEVAYKTLVWLYREQQQQQQAFFPKQVGIG